MTEYFELAAVLCKSACVGSLCSYLKIKLFDTNKTLYLFTSDLAHVFSSVRRDLNFIDHTSELGWKE